VSKIGMDERNQPAPEEQDRHTYPFLAGLAEDHPQLAQEVTAKLPQWKQELGTYIGNTQAPEAMLQAMDYVSVKEMAEIVQGWVTEVQDLLHADPDRKIVFIKGIGGSQRYFAELVYKQLPPELQSRVTVLGDDRSGNDITRLPRDFDTFVKTDFFLFDDSINSGQQLTGLVLPTFANMGRKLERQADEDDRNGDFFDLVYGRMGKKPHLHIRTMRMTAYAEDRITTEWKRRKSINDKNRGASYPEALVLDLQAQKKMPTINEVLDPLDIEWPNGELPAPLFRQDQVVGWPILGMFATKIQDNLPAAMLKSKITPPEIQPLFSQKDITTPWKT
jgi:hypothetical protein